MASRLRGLKAPGHSGAIAQAAKASGLIPGGNTLLDPKKSLKGGELKSDRGDNLAEKKSFSRDRRRARGAADRSGGRRG